MTLCLTAVAGGITEDCGVTLPRLQVTSRVPSANAFKFKVCGSYAAAIKALKIIDSTEIRLFKRLVWLKKLRIFLNILGFCI